MPTQVLGEGGGVVGWFYALLGVYCIALLITAIYTMHKKRGCTVFAAFAVVYVAAIIAIVVSEMCG
jgi:hypothetical protein